MRVAAVGTSAVPVTASPRREKRGEGGGGEGAGPFVSAGCAGADNRKGSSWSQCAECRSSP